METRTTSAVFTCIGIRGLCFDPLSHMTASCTEGAASFSVLPHVSSSHLAITNPIPAHAGARSPDNGLLTPAMKLARPAISKAYEKEIKAS